MRPGYLLGLVALAALYYGASELGTSLAFADNATALWPPAGLAAAVVVVFGFRWLPGIALGEIAALIAFGTPIEVAAPQFAGNLAEPVVAALIIRRLCGGRPRFRTLSAIGALMAAAVPAAACSATPGVLGLLASDAIASGDFWTAWYRWLLADVASMMLVVPLLAVITDRGGRDDLPRRHPLEILGAGFTVIASSFGVLVATDLPLSFAAFPGLVWCALRLGRVGAVLASSAAGAIAIAGVAAEKGPFAANAGESEALLLAQGFVSVAALTTLALAIVNKQRMLAALERERSLAELQAILNAAPAAVYVKDLAGRYKLASKYLEQVWGGSVVGKTDHDLMPPEAAAEIVAADERLARTGETYESERVIPEPRGDRIYRGQRFPIVDADGRVTGVGGISLDVTEEREAGHRLERSEELLQRTAELGRVGGWEYDVTSENFFWSDQMFALHGVDADDFEPSFESWRTLTHPDDQDRAMEIFTAALEPGGEDTWESRRRTIWPNGEVHVLLGRGQVHRAESGDAVRVTGFDQDITALAAAEGELRRSEELLARTSELGGVGGWQCTLPEQEFTWSAELYRIHGVDPETFVPTSESWGKLLHPEDAERSVAAMNAIREQRKAMTWEHRRRILRPDGETRVLLGRGQIHVDETGEPYLVTGFDQDITELAAAEEKRRETQELMERISELGRVGGWSVDPTAGKFTWSAELYRIHGVDPETFEITSESWMSLLHPDDAHVGKLIEEAITSPDSDGWHLRRRIVRPDGEIRVLEGRGQIDRDPDGAPVQITGYDQDITEMIAKEEELARAERRYRSLVERLPAVSYVAKAGPQGEWTYVSPQIERMLGYTPEEWMADPTLWERCIHPEDRERVVDVERQGAATGAPVAMEYRMQARDGRTLWIRDEALVRPDADRVFFDGMLTDITERKAFETQLQFLADHDPLTGLFNRRRFVEELSLEAKLVLRDGHCSTVVMLDLDNFKYVNDSLGHRAGDVLIRGIADTLERRLRDTDTLARLGGDEFAALLRGTSPEEARVVVAELLDAIRERTHALSDEPVRVTASAGMVALDDAVSSAEELLAAADLAMYEAKQTGRDRVAVFSVELQHEVRSGRSWADRIRSALDTGSFELFCQPIVDLSTNLVSQHEILLRMRSDDGKIVAPDAFLPLAERFDLIQQVDRWVALETVALMERRLEAGQRLRLEVNLSAKSLVDPDFMTALEGALHGSPVDPADLIFEVTETAAIANMDEARAFSERLRRLGCGFALDDFGSGFASFYYLKHLPVDYVKIDGDFVRSLTASAVDQQVVKAMIAIAKALGQKTVAEFVGDQPTVELLRKFGVDYVQGYYLGVPVPVARLSDGASVETRS